MKSIYILLLSFYLGSFVFSQKTNELTFEFSAHQANFKMNDLENYVKPENEFFPIFYTENGANNNLIQSSNNLHRGANYAMNLSFRPFKNFAFGIFGSFNKISLEFPMLYYMLIRKFPQ